MTSYVCFSTNLSFLACLKWQKKNRRTGIYFRGRGQGIYDDGLGWLHLLSSYGVGYGVIYVLFSIYQMIIEGVRICLLGLPFWMTWLFF